MGFDLALELVDLLSKNKVVAGLSISVPVPHAKNYQQNFLERNISIKTAKQYLLKKFNIVSSRADNILDDLGISANERISWLKWSKRKALTIKGLLANNNIISFDYYGISADSIDWINDIIQHELNKEKCFIGFNNLQYMEEQEPYDNFERIVVAYNGKI
ncbi:hypothetical protein F1C16_10840 [Hymenobacter sp. NBH84]|uniref:hypothetical protein n=1 Tax=Hymenobacter sp. NBH84 TaxID=2596915 RepID=UPI001629BCB0|nr:hypothetical protein [Hymenobacter sp. NBH84]QNE40019.1 hypothetical protein F1C16_10840 [Hymenobacter sp. NBH84]